MDNNINIGIAAPVYSYEKFSGLCTESILQQSLASFQFVAAGDGISFKEKKREINLLLSSSGRQKLKEAIDVYPGQSGKNNLQIIV